MIVYEAKTNSIRDNLAYARKKAKEENDIVCCVINDIKVCVNKNTTTDECYKSYLDGLRIKIWSATNNQIKEK